MKKLVFIVIGHFLFSNLSFSHEHWINLENCYPKIEEKVKIFICSGHNFPKSSFVLDSRLLCNLKIIGLEKEYNYETIKGKDCLVSEVVFSSKGTHILTFSLKKPQLKEPLFWAKSIICVENIKCGQELYEIGKGLEIIPDKNLFALKKDESLPLKICYNEKPAKSTLSISIDGKKNFFLQTNKGGIAKLKIKRGGTYLITTSHKGKGCSLTFFIKNLKKK